MKHNYILIWMLIMVCPAMIRAERIYTPHSFDTMHKNGDLTITNSNTIGRTALAWYQCSGTNAKFFTDHVYSTYISIRLPRNGSTVTTSKINELDEFTIGMIPDNVDRSNIKVMVSTDSISWDGPLSDASVIEYSNGSIHVTLPRNNYYVRIYNTMDSKDTSISSIQYYQDHCNCFIYNP